MEVMSAERSSEHAMADWDIRLTYVITPKSGPLRRMVRLRDAKQALADLPPGYLKRVHWLRAWRAVLAAAETGTQRDIEWAFEKLVAAVAEEGWFTRGLSPTEPPRFEPARSKQHRSQPLHSVPLRNVRASVGDVTPRPAAEPLWRRILPVGTNRQAIEVQHRVNNNLGPKDLRQFVRQHFLVLPGSDA